MYPKYVRVLFSEYNYSFDCVDYYWHVSCFGLYLVHLFIAILFIF